MPPGQLLLAGQSIVGNAAVASRAVNTPRRPTTPGAVARTKPPPAAEVKRQDRADTADRPDRSKPKADTSGRRTPDTDPKFRALKKDVATKKHVVGTSHPPATREAGAAQAAAVAPADDQEARGKAAHAEEMAKAEPKEFNKDAFVKAVQEAVAARAPKTLDDADKFGKSGKADEIKQEVQGQVGEGKDASAKQIADTTAQAPQPAPDKKPVVPLAPDQPPDRPAGPNPTHATPDPLPPAATDLSASPEQVAYQMADAQVTEPQLARSNEPTFTGALADKKNLDKHAETAPKELRAGERRELNQVKTTAAAQGPQAMASMLGTRVAVGQQVATGKTGAKSRDEDKRTKVTALLQEVFDKTKCDVEKILSDLDKKVDDQFTKGEKDARDKFTREYTLGIKEYKRKRYDWPWGKGQWLLDLVLPTPPEVDRIYQTARDNYLIALNQVITEIAGTVETELRRAKDRIVKGRKQLQEAVTKLPKDLKAIGQEATKDFESKFDDLKDTVNDKGTELVDTLATRYTEAVREIDKQIVEEKEKNKTLFEKAGDAMTGAINSILELKNMLMGVLRKAVTAISAIIKDPIGFLGNLVTAVGGGLKLFMKNVGKHLQQGLFAWLLGTATTAGLQLPSKFDVLGILTMIAALLGLTWPNLRSRIARKVPDEAITAAETAVPPVVEAKKRGVAGMWDDLKTHVGDLKKDLISKLIAYLTPTIIIAGITWILSLLNPASAFVRACKMIIDIVRFIITQAAQIIEFVNAVLDAVIAIARGGSGGVPALVERALARSIPVLIGALAAILGIGGIAAKVKQIFQSLARPVNRAIDRVIDKIIALVKKLWAKLKAKFDKRRPGKHRKPEDHDEPGPLRRPGWPARPKRPCKPKKPHRPSRRKDPKDRRDRYRERSGDVRAALRDAMRLIRRGATVEGVRGKLPRIRRRRRIATLKLVIVRVEDARTIVYFYGDNSPGQRTPEQSIEGEDALEALKSELPGHLPGVVGKVHGAWWTKDFGEVYVRTSTETRKLWQKRDLDGTESDALSFARTDAGFHTALLLRLARSTDKVKQVKSREFYAAVLVHDVDAFRDFLKQLAKPLPSLFKGKGESTLANIRDLDPEHTPRLKKGLRALGPGSYNVARKEYGRFRLPHGVRPHKKFRPIWVSTRLMDNQGLGLTFVRTATGDGFYVKVQKKDEGDITVIGLGLRYRAGMGRGVTDRASGWPRRSGIRNIDSAHLIANEFGGSGHSGARNLIITSSHYNQNVMRYQAEKPIAESIKAEAARRGVPVDEVRFILKVTASFVKLQDNWAIGEVRRELAENLDVPPAEVPDVATLLKNKLNASGINFPRVASVFYEWTFVGGDGGWRTISLGPDVWILLQEQFKL